MTKSLTQRRQQHIAQAMARFSTEVARKSGSSGVFFTALFIVIAWGMTGPLFHYSDTWQLVINTSTTIVTFLMVFLIQRAQNKDSLAIQLKLNEIVAALDGASNHLIDVENLSEQELEVLHEHFRLLVRMARHDASVTASHSVEEAQARHERKPKPAGHRGDAKPSG